MEANKNMECSIAKLNPGVFASSIGVIFSRYLRDRNVLLHKYDSIIL